MLKFFRRIRRKLIDEGNLKRYLIYSIGEILLVVIGILIALKVNNWNSNQLKKKEEIKTLKEVNEGFKSDFADVQINVFVQGKSSESIDLLLNKFEQDAAYHDSLSTHFAIAINPTILLTNSSAYETLKVKGVDLISNDTLRQGILKMHDYYYEAIKSFENGIFISNPYLNEYCVKHFDRVESVRMNEKGEWEYGQMKPNDFEQLKKDKEFASLLRSHKSQIDFVLDFMYRDIQHNLQNLIKEIEDEVSRLE